MTFEYRKSRSTSLRAGRSVTSIVRLRTGGVGPSSDAHWQQNARFGRRIARRCEHADAIVFFRLGDFYEMFFDDAVTAARALNLTLTTRDKNKPNPVPMCGVPHHALDGYLGKHPYFGSTVGRYCNRIGGGKFTLDGKQYTLATNDNDVNHLHGGKVGFIVEARDSVVRLGLQLAVYALQATEPEIRRD